MHLLSVLSMKNRALIALVTIVAAVFGVLAVGGLKQELIPSVQFPQLAIITSYPGAAPEVVNDDVSTPIETAIQGVPGIESTSATSSTNTSLISATFTYGTDLATAEQKITQAINRIKSTLPDTVDPQVVSGSIDDLPVIQIAVSGAADQDSLAEVLSSSVVPDIKDVDGVRDAAIVGEVGKRVTITPDDAKLALAGQTSRVIGTTLQQNGSLQPAGDITEGDKTFSVQTGTKLTSVDDIAALPIAGAFAADGSVLTIGDVATVALSDDPITSISRVDGEPALTIAVTKLPAANTVEVSQGVRDILPELERTIGSDAKLTVVFDQAPYIEQSIEALTTEGLLGLVFAVLIILVFLLDVRATLVTAISIPTSVLITFIGLQVAEYSLNILTLGALTIAIGRVVDDSIVVIENIKRHLSFGDNRTGAQRAGSILSAVQEVAGAITASTITTVAVFLPIAFVGDVTGELFRPFALTVTIALLASLLVALTIVPVLAYWFLRAPKAQRLAAAAAAEEVPSDAATGPVRSRRERRVSVQDEDDLEKPSRLQKAYLPIIHWTLKHSVTTLLLSVLVLGGTIVLIPSMKTNFLGDSGQNTLTVTQTLPVGTSLDAQDAAAKQVETKLRDIDGIDTVQLSIGSSGSSLRDAFSGGGGGAITYSITTSEDADQTALQKTVRKDLSGLDDVGEIEVAASAGFGGSSDIEIDITSARQSDLAEAADAIQQAVTGLDGIDQVTSNLSESRPYVQVAVNRDAAAAAGFSEVALGAYVSQLMQPTTVGSIVIDDATLTIYVDTQDPPTTVDELAATQVPTATGPRRLDALATVSQVDGPATISTVKGLRSATISATPGSDNLGTASAEVQTAIDDVKLPAGTTATLGGVTASQSDAFGQLGLALLAAILIVYVIMVATFRSLRQPLELLVSVPFAATGAIGLQVITGVPLGVPSIIGALMLIGIVVTNAIVLVDLVNQYRRRGMTVIEAVEHGAARRLRPILMTALATIFALTPMALGVTGHGGFISQPLAIIVIGGLISSTVLTLVVLPSLYNLVEGFRERREQRRAAAEPKPTTRTVAAIEGPRAATVPAEEPALVDAGGGSATTAPSVPDTSVPSASADVAPVDAAPDGAAPADAEPADEAPIDSVPADADPADAVPTNSDAAPEPQVAAPSEPAVDRPMTRPAVHEVHEAHEVHGAHVATGDELPRTEAITLPDAVSDAPADEVVHSGEHAAPAVQPQPDAKAEPVARAEAVAEAEPVAEPDPVLETEPAGEAEAAEKSELPADSSPTSDTAPTPDAEPKPDADMAPGTEPSSGTERPKRRRAQWP
ncbi:hydrophobic/amphiphilic exporter-1, HAE1 family [Plantibacter flavus]|uniref:HAE1 family hydrophobic/amphiphilic exporter-1 n=1 Tax=Plantibacter flavus TaxID=150123 RepID=A0A3N2BZM9_9MICO|nr:efflux RND transporter permease subunit [Plantibacter flavus]ROR80726.1 HAE1 family hydrophobic/amphiphilic exporter-1 [Plantibacter flavus]SMG31650.1 hydrophobic/amphiphilic exporter-1, HAE1 family [Plantibacter flavus]